MRSLRIGMALVVLLMAATTAATATEKSGRQRDLDIAVQYVDTAPSLTTEARGKAHERIAFLREQADSMTDGQFLFAMMQIAALADNGHDNIHPGSRAWFPALRLPVRMIWFPDALIVARASSEHADLLGASIVSVEGLTPDQLLQRLRPLQGGVDAYRRWGLSWVFHSPEALHALGIAQSPDRLKLQLKKKDGGVVNRVLIARPKAEMPPGLQPSRYWLPTPFPGEKEKGWRAAINPDKAPLYLQDGNAWFRMVELPNIEALYVQFRSNMDEEDAAISPFVASVSRKLQQDPPRNVIVDLRFDTGGDNTQNRELMKQIAQTTTGHIYVLIGNYTFSAGIASAAALVHDGGPKVSIVGSEIGDRTHWWSEHGDPLYLPNSDICFSINTGYWDLVNGCKANPKCFGDQFHVTVPSLAPSIPAPLRSADWLANRDPGFDAIIADIRKGKH